MNGHKFRKKKIYKLSYIFLDIFLVYLQLPQHNPGSRGDLPYNLFMAKKVKRAPKSSKKEEIPE